MTETLKEEFRDLDQVGAVFLDIDQKFKNADFTKPLEEFRVDLEHAENDNWDGRHSPVKTQWPKLAAATIKRKGHDQPLVLTGALRASMTDHNAAFHVGGVTHRGLVFGTSIPYAESHQDGTSLIPQREFAGMDEPLLQQAIDSLVDSLVDQLKYTTRG
ncbi:MAG: hypothetical protein U0872_14185 [Planctomycetaceae bacterium]